MVVEVSAVGTVAAFNERSMSVHELQGLTGVHSRDLRALYESGGEGAFRALIQPRGHHAVLLRMGMIQAVLTAHRFLMFRATDPAKTWARLRLLPIAQQVANQRRGVSCTTEGETLLPEYFEGGGFYDPSADFEVRCLAAVLGVTQRRLSRRARCFGPVVERLLQQVTSEEPEEALTQLLRVQRALSELERCCETAVHCLSQLLQSDEEMLSLLLTAKHNLPDGKLPPSSLHVTVEALLESYHHSFQEVTDQLFLNIRAIEATQRVVQISFESKRTRLLFLEVHISVGAMSLACVSTISSLFGMNLHSGLENTPGLFWIAVWSSMGLGALMYGAYRVFLRHRDRILKQRLDRMKRMCLIARQMPDLTDMILSQLDSIASPDSSRPGHAGSLCLPLSGLGDKTYLSMDDFRGLFHSMMREHNVSDREIVALFETLDSDNNGRLEHSDIADFLCIQSSPLPGLGPFKDE